MVKLAKVGSKAPQFALSDQDGVERSLSNYLGSWVLLYFYPKDDTPGCTLEACTIRDQFKNFKKIKAVVLGISTDSVASHRKFVDAYKLPFTLLADIDKQVVNQYGVWGEKNMMGRKYMGTLRTSFLIDPNGKIKKVYEKVKPALHAEEVLSDLKEFQK